MDELIRKQDALDALMAENWWRQQSEHLQTGLRPCLQYSRTIMLTPAKWKSFAVRIASTGIFKLET